MPRSDPEVGKVGQRLGRLQAAPMADVPNLPNLPYLSPHVWERAPAHIRARAGNSFYVGKVRKVRNRAGFIGLQGSELLPYLLEVRKDAPPC